MEFGCLGARVPTSSSLHGVLCARAHLNLNSELQCEVLQEERILGCAVRNRGRPRCCAAQPSKRKGEPIAALVLMASRSGLNLGASVRSAAGGAYSGLCTQGQGETSIYCTARSSKKEGGQTLDGTHPRLAQPTCPLGASSKFRLAGRARLFRGPGLSTAYFPT